MEQRNNSNLRMNMIKAQNYNKITCITILNCILYQQIQYDKLFINNPCTEKIPSDIYLKLII